MGGGPVAILQAAIVSLVTFGVIYMVAVRLGLDRRLAATLGTGGAVCGVSGAIASGAAVGAKKEQVSIAIALVVLWAIITVFLLPLVARELRLSTGVAGAWIGTSEFADAAGLAAAQTYGGYAGQVPGIEGSADSALNAFTLMKVIGRDVWIGVWAFVLSIVATTRWETIGIESTPRVGEVWRRFPKFVLGFLLASALIAWVTRGHSYAEYKQVLQPALVAPLQALRVWTFTFAFLSIGTHHALPRVSPSRGGPLLCFYYRSRGQHRARLRALDRGVRAFLVDPRIMSPLLNCGTCQHFCQAGAELEASLPGLRSLGSAYSSVRAADGLCTLHARYLTPTSSCAMHEERHEA